MSEIDKKIEEKRQRLINLVGTDKADKIIKQDIKRKENERLLTKGIKHGFTGNILGIEQLIRSLAPGVSEREKNYKTLLTNELLRIEMF